MGGAKNPASGYGWVDPDAVAAIAPSLYQTHHRYHNSNNDISESMMNEEVQGFANPNTETLNWARTEDQFIPNGSLNPASGYGYVNPDAAALLQHHHRHHARDVSEKQIDEEVHGFVNPNTETLNWARSQDPFIMNGSKNPESGYGYVPPAELYQHRHHRYNPNYRRDISEKQIDEDVHDFANPNTEVLNWPRTPDSFIPNGSKNPESGYGYVPPALLQHHNRHNMRDVSEKQIDEEVHGFVNPNTETLNWARSQDPFIMNGSK